MKQIIIRSSIILTMNAMFAIPAHAEDTGLINALNAQTRAQVKAHKSNDPVLLGKLDRETTKNLKNLQAQVNAAKKQMGAGVRG